MTFWGALESASTTRCAGASTRYVTRSPTIRRGGPRPVGLVADLDRVGGDRTSSAPPGGGGPAHRHRSGVGRLALCHQARVPVTAAGGRSGVCGASVPLFGGVALDLCGLAGFGRVDAESLVADVRAGTFGPDVESGLRADHGLTLGHWPQSMDLSTVGGWLACRGAGQYSNRYGKIEDMVIGLEVVLSDGVAIRTGGNAPRAATGPDLTSTVGSEGTLGVITEGRFRVHPVPVGEDRRAFGSPPSPTASTPVDGSCDTAPPRLSSVCTTGPMARSFDLPDTNVLIVLDEATPASSMRLAVVDDQCGHAQRLETELVGRWLEHRNDVSALAPLFGGRASWWTPSRWRPAGVPFPPCTTRCSKPWAGWRKQSSPQSTESHAYADGACLYFTFDADRRPVSGPTSTGPGRQEWMERYYRAGLGPDHRGHRGMPGGHQSPPRHRPQPGPLPSARWEHYGYPRQTNDVNLAGVQILQQRGEIVFIGIDRG